MEVDELGRRVPAEPPPYKVKTTRCYGCVAQSEESDRVPKDMRDSIHYHFSTDVDDGDCEHE